MMSFVSLKSSAIRGDAGVNGSATIAEGRNVGTRVAKKAAPVGLGQRWQEISRGFKKRPQYVGPRVSKSFRAYHPNG
jgi:hypothetical protein